KAPEPHPLPLTRQWVEDFKHYGTRPKSEGEIPAPGLLEQWLEENPPPDLQELVERAGRRHPVSLGEAYTGDGYQHLTAEEWAEYDRAMADWQRRYRERR